MRRGDIRLALISAIVGLMAPLWGATYHVAGQATQAADNNPGTVARPLKSISAAMARVRPGDTIVVHKGTYREAVIYPGEDWKDPSKRITLTAAPGEKPIIKGSEVLPARWERLPGERPIYFQPREAYTQLLFCDGQPLQQIGLQGSPKRAAGTNGFQFQKQWRGHGVADMGPGSFYYDAAQKRLYVWLAGGDNPRQHLMEAAVRADGLLLRGTWTVRGLQVCHIADDYWPHEQAAAIIGDRCIVEHCRFVHNDFVGLIVHGQDCVIRHNEIAYNGLMGFTSNVGYRMLFEGNTLHHNAWRGDVKCLTAGNKFVMWRDSRIWRNYWHDEPATALWLDISNANILIAENRFERCYCGIYFEISRWGVIANNILRQCGRGIWSYSSDVLVAHNVLDQCGEGIVVSTYPRHGNYNQAVSEPNEECLMAVRNNLIVNNLLLDSVGAFIGICADDAYGGNNWADHNAFVWTLPTSHSTGMHIHFMNGWDLLYSKLPIWRAERHQDMHSVLVEAELRRQHEQGNPWIGLSEEDLLAEAGLSGRGRGDYQLRADSPLRGRGVRLPDRLQAPYRPGVGNKLVSRAFARTRGEAAPPGLGRRLITEFGGGHYRLQPLPPLRPLVELDLLPPDDIGLNERWIASGRYPTFDTEAPPEESAADEWSVFPENRLRDPSLMQPLGKPGSPAAWIARGAFHSYAGMACANLLPAQPASTIEQLVGRIAAHGEYILWGDAFAQSADPHFIVHCRLMLAAGEERQPLGTPAEIVGRPGQRAHWRTVFTRYKAGAADKDAFVGKELYVVLAAWLAGPTNVEAAEPVGFVRGDNLILLTSETVERK